MRVKEYVSPSGRKYTAEFTFDPNKMDEELNKLVSKILRDRHKFDAMGYKTGTILNGAIMCRIKKG